MVPAETSMSVYMVVLDTVRGLMEVELISTTSERAANRARMTVLHTREYGDIDQVQWISVEEVVCRYFAKCDRTATGFVRILGTDVPTCQRCAERAESLRKGSER
jgi:hypothetical protein